jgi:pSer/pThr/pTyr-binding forkhead associated (FHA) protein
MRYPHVTLDIDQAGQDEQHYVFESPQTCVVGRANDCDVRIDETDRPREVSRHHCLLEIDPPTIRIYDLFSTNGTYVNGTRVNPGSQATDVEQSTGVELKDGDEIRLGKSTLHVWVSETEEEPMLLYPMIS